GDRTPAHARRRADGLGLRLAARNRDAGRLRSERERGAESWQDADRVRLRRDPPLRVDDDGALARSSADGDERRAPRKSVLHARQRDVERHAPPALDLLRPWRTDRRASPPTREVDSSAASAT